MPSMRPGRALKEVLTMSDITLEINGRKIQGSSGDTILKVCEKNAIVVPTLCHFEGLADIGVCRMCLVEVKGARGLVPACTTQATDGMVVVTENDEIRDLRRSNLEMLFSERNHFCMFCEKSGDCELQKLAYEYGLDHISYGFFWPELPMDISRKYFLYDQNRCILCRRCLRACEELAGHAVLTVRDRGPKSMICADVDLPFNESTCVSCGTCLQVCPTGALADRKSTYIGRQEHMTKTRSACAFCSIGCEVEISSRDGEPLRIEGIFGQGPTSGILCSKGRFELLFEVNKRLDRPLLREDEGKRGLNLNEALSVLAKKIKEWGINSFAGLISPRATNEAASQFKKLFGDNVFLIDSFSVPLGNASIEEIDDADCIVVVGANLDEEFKALSSFVKRGANLGSTVVVMGSAGAKVDIRATYRFHDEDIDSLSEVMGKFSNPLVVYGPGTKRSVMEFLWGLRPGVRQLGLARGSNIRGIEKLKIKPWKKDKGFRGLYVLLGDFEVSDDLLGQLGNAEFLAVQSCYENEAVNYADLALPSRLWFERSGTYINTEGKVRHLEAIPEIALPLPSDEEILKGLIRLLD
ncbi:MAG: 2Fe-2S iron-sulfur cluster-binding protein [Acetomicrobium sp.]